MSRRRSHGAGSIRRRGDDLYELRVSFGTDAEGKRIRKSYFGPTEASVIAQRDRDRARFEATNAVPGQPVTVEAFVRQWLDVQRLSWRPSTTQSRTSWIERRILPPLGRHRLDRLSPAHVAAFVKDLQRDLAPKTARDVTSLLKQILSDAVDWGYIDRSPANPVPTPSVPERDPRFLTPAQVRDLLDRAGEKDPQFARLCAVAVGTGLRLGELLALRWNHVDLDKGFLKVEQALTRVEGGWEVGPPKTKRSRRTVLLPDVAIDALARERVAQKEARLKAGTAWTERGYVFANATGDHLRPAWVQRRAGKIFAEMGLEGYSMHVLRHTYGTLLRSKRVPDRVIQDALGHTTPQMTARYAHLTLELLDDAKDALNEALGG